MRWHTVVAAAAAALPVAANNAQPPKSQLAAPVRIEADDKPIDITEVGHAAPFFADGDGDGDLDLLVGHIEGQVHLVINEGSKTKPSFGKDVLLKAGNEPIKLAGGDAGPTVADWDGDGKFDLLVGTGGGGVFWFRNTGT